MKRYTSRGGAATYLPRKRTRKGRKRKKKREEKTNDEEIKLDDAG
jgi:hypothetical protein